ncbi:hypothetical protein [Agrobacterium sp.]|uniref:hypothetical protein n=1 Tax=Agrobacterium sp. TaxID=361 RepID=UPI0025C280D9|nr:hypothetical protein [Agrobacterium sp.]MCD4661910.1 hypothetical protein [Agrobacterium sp.]
MKIDARTSFERKLNELEAVVETLKNGRYPLEPFPDNVIGFRTWQRAGLFDAWISKTVDAPNGSYPDLAARLRVLLQDIEKYSLKGLRRRIRERDQTLSVLAKQNTELEALVRELADKLDAAGKLSKADRSKVIQLYR